MTKKNESVIVVGSSGFSDKRIKFDGVSIDGESVKEYLDKLVVDEVVTELEEEADSVNTVYRKPRLRYKSEVEQPGKVVILTRDDIKREEQIEQFKKELPLFKSKIPYVIAAFLTGETFTYEQLYNFIKNYFGKDIPVKQLQQKPSTIKKTRMGFLLKKVGLNPSTYAFDPRTKAFSLPDVYSLYQKTGISLEAFCIKYPVTLEILKDKGIDIPDIDAANGNVNADTGVPERCEKVLTRKERIDMLKASSDMSDEERKAVLDMVSNPHRDPAAYPVSQDKINRFRASIDDVSEELVDAIHVRPTDSIDMSDEEYQALVDEMKKDEPEDKPTRQGLQGFLEQFNGGKFDINININFNIGFAKK